MGQHCKKPESIFSWAYQVYFLGFNFGFLDAYGSATICLQKSSCTLTGSNLMKLLLNFSVVDCFSWQWAGDPKLKIQLTFVRRQEGSFGFLWCEHPGIFAGQGSWRSEWQRVKNQWLVWLWGPRQIAPLSFLKNRVAMLLNLAAMVRWKPACSTLTWFTSTWRHLVAI